MDPISLRVLALAAATVSLAVAAASAAEPTRGRLVLEETFDGGLGNWQPEGPHAAGVRGGKLHVKTHWPDDPRKQSGQFLWLKRDLPADFRVEYDVTPLSESGFFLVFFCAKGTGGQDILGDELFRRYAERRDFEKYTIGPVNCYHISYRRNEAADCNLRKNTGKHLLKTASLKALLPRGKPAHVALTKVGGHIRLVVNGQVFMDHTDDGTLNGGVYSGGK
ncbi:MAG TPA: DUF1961 family protein, partial [Phycisphaerae bacterium]|nr:DUF1961 family protein [Phycisphaerae bacterium]